MCHPPWKIVGLLHSQVFRSYVVHITFVLVDCVETFVVLFVYNLVWISRQPVFGDST